MGSQFYLRVILALLLRCWMRKSGVSLFTAVEVSAEEHVFLSLEHWVVHLM